MKKYYGFVQITNDKIITAIAKNKEELLFQRIANL